MFLLKIINMPKWCVWGGMSWTSVAVNTLFRSIDISSDSSLHTVKCPRKHNHYLYLIKDKKKKFFTSVKRGHLFSGWRKMEWLCRNTGQHFHSPESAPDHMKWIPNTSNTVPLKYNCIIKTVASARNNLDCYPCF